MQSGPRPLALVESGRNGKRREEFAIRNHIRSLRFKKNIGNCKKNVWRDRCIHMTKKLQKVYHEYYKFRFPTLLLLTIDSSKQNLNNII